MSGLVLLVFLAVALRAIMRPRGRKTIAESGREPDKSSRQAICDSAKALEQEKAVRDGLPARGCRAADAANAERRVRLAGYELLGRLGRGSTGTVLLARQVSMNRLVALKILPSKLARSPDFIKRFIRQARCCAMLHHPNIVGACDVGMAEGYYYFAMEYVDGETLKAVLRRVGALGQDLALALMKQVACALACTHEAGIVHRNIKPSSLMLDANGRVVLIDFCCAKQMEGDIAVTPTGSIIGTPGYMAPEMAKDQEADARSDLYSLGATFFHVLAGRPPFEGRSLYEVLYKQVSEKPPALATLAPHVDHRFCGVIDRLLRKEPAARYPSALALLDALEGLGELAPV